MVMADPLDLGHDKNTKREKNSKCTKKNRKHTKSNILHFIVKKYKIQKKRMQKVKKKIK